MEKIRIGVVGYGNLGRGVHIALKQNADIELVAIFTRREPETVKTLFPAKVDKIDNIKDYVGKIDVMVMCGGSATDLPCQTPEIAKYFNTIDSFDTHAKIPDYFKTVDKVARENNNLSVISVGWDPGLFSIARALFASVLPVGETYTFWGKGVSQGHSDAIRRIKGVKNAIQYTIPIEEALNRVRNLENPTLSTGEKHLRECFVVAEDGADKAQIEKEIVTMPNYFADYKTIVHFISEEELKANHSKMSHGGLVLRSGESANDNKFLLEFSLKLESNPEFTSSVLIAFTRALFRMKKEGFVGCKTVLDIPIGYLSAKGDEAFEKGIGLMLDNFVELKEEDLKLFEAVAREIWEEHFTHIIGSKQVQYMLKKFQSYDAVKKQIEDGYKYFFIKKNGSILGYFAFKKEQNKLFLSKLYLKKEHRGNGYSRIVLNFLIKECDDNNLKCIYLTVNRNNFDTIKVYEKMNFYKLEEKKADIGGGFFMDDYVMQMNI